MSLKRQEKSRIVQTRRIRRIDVTTLQTASSDIARDINRDIILELIRFKQPLARADLARLSGLRPSTVSKIVEQLVRENWVTEGAVVKPARGRPSTMLTVNSSMVTFALDMRPDHSILAIVDLSGRFLHRENIPGFTDLKRTVVQIGKRIRGLRKQHPHMSFEGIGVSVPGRVHPITQRVLLSPNLKWHDFDLKGALERESDLQVEIENDANVCLISELWYGRLQGARNVVLVAVAEGLGTAILAGGDMQFGSNGLAGEFGHVLVDPNGPLCGCGQKGCWEVIASSRATVRMFNESSGRKVESVYEVMRLSEDGNRNAIKALTAQARALGRGMRMITATLSPELILVVGDITSSWDSYHAIIEQELSDSMLAGMPPVLRAAGDAELARLSGSAAMLMQRHATYHRSTHERRP
ncbi:MAG: ROK family transcriptional regulator [Edaphobacter sp.]|uniref:ROK family transcriptional regulator n=1 Tax=Edaphobacter sp. TaxID=1934404 RepID=UPI00238B9416|nr:ROK family transcriptional regulator [Edaphobacter sp.]MDE1177306.1 ROK family transcriptional regulator [Edaphobacter sp.]